MANDCDDDRRYQLHVELERRITALEVDQRMLRETMHEQDKALAIIGSKEKIGDSRWGVISGIISAVVVWIATKFMEGHIK